MPQRYYRFLHSNLVFEVHFFDPKRILKLSLYDTIKYYFIKNVSKVCLTKLILDITTSGPTIGSWADFQPLLCFIEGLRHQRWAIYRKLIIAGHVNKSCHDLCMTNYYYSNVIKHDRIKNDNGSLYHYTRQPWSILNNYLIHSEKTVNSENTGGGSQNKLWIE